MIPLSLLPQLSPAAAKVYLVLVCAHRVGPQKHLPLIVMAIQGNNAIDVSRKMMGATFGFKAEPGTIRGDYGISSSFNLIHGSDSPDSAKTELALWFKPEELFTYDLANRVWTYDYAKGSPE